ncbi:MAG TPA: PQ-loop domain-containing transporter [Spirochaetota bacterium]|jgi:uncharacterized protein with PQ loop repeat|nr:PQ-loop domain-containing transporter [Spirochaetota bacterium]HPJ16106.1 PQ-loop domain-containing transporter [Spirochaetota bacterium]HQO21547.1 PQ-loop domain-containing transporter [Spirochaetota bacterium]HQQ22925.1 PQ-loop domain-containing transporter [Spirochaetota bacterium]
MSIFEMGMMIAFGFAWPFSIYKSFKSKSTKGKSIHFLLIVVFGYVCGLIHKILYNQDIVIIFYALNTLMVLIDSILYLRNAIYERKTKAD